MNSYVIGLDYGSDSARAVVVDTADGKILATSVKYYPRWKEGRYCDASSNRYRQHPLDYIEVLEQCVREVTAGLPSEVVKNIKGIAFDTTGSTPAFTDEHGMPLALKEEFAENPNAMFVLWKDHTAVKEADEINALCKRWSTDYSEYEGGIYSSEWFWAKMLHILREDDKVRKAACSVVEHCEWLPALLTGVNDAKKIIRSRCAEGHKAMWHAKWGGLPDQKFLSELDPLLDGWRDRLFEETETADKPVGHLTKEWAARLGLSTDVVVAGGAFDCHMGAVGACVKPHTLVRIIGTSTCDVMVADYDEIGDKLIRGICGQVDGSVIPGMVGLEAGQSAFGDVYAWFRRVVEYPLRRIASDVLSEEQVERMCEAVIPALTADAQKIPMEESTAIAVDWMNGRRTPDADQMLKGAIAGITLGTSAPLIFRALVEATAFGSRAIMERFIEQGVKIDTVIGIGGIALKSPFVMQTLSDVMNVPIKVCRTDQACALGAAMFAATAAGLFENVEQAQEAMSSGFAKTYRPDKGRALLYDGKYVRYKQLGAFCESEAHEMRR